MKSTEPIARPAFNIGWLTAAAFYGFFVFGFTDNLKGPMLPNLLDDLLINYSTGGTILLGSYVGFVVASLLAGLLAEARGLKSVLILAGGLTLIGVAGFSFANTAVFLMLFMLFQGFGMGALELGVNSLIVQLYESNKGRYLNLMAVMHGLGATLAPLYAGLLLTNGQSWRFVFRWDLVLVGLLLLFFGLMRFPPRLNDNTENRLSMSELRSMALSPTLLLSCIALTCYVAVEISVAAWLVEYLQSVHNLDVGLSTLALSIFFGLIMLGRIIGSILVDRIGHLQSVLIGMIAATFCLGFGLFLPQAFWLLPISGLFLSITFPTLTAAVSTLFTKNVSAILGILFAFAGIGGILGPWAVGFVADRTGIQWGFSLILIFAVLTLLSVFNLKRSATA